MQLRNVRDRKTPELIIIPMIDIMFFLLVFFMLASILRNFFLAIRLSMNMAM